ncbi:MAG: hypothetical protein J6Z38_00925 [Lachnospiraceae bacterium]|nr:hypothetical protein [Lachnospiraceae bacterium]
MKKSLKLFALVLAAVLLFCSVPAMAAGNTQTYTKASEIADLVGEGYNKGTKGPITVTQGTLKSGWSTKNVYLVTLSGTEMVFNQSTEWITDLFCGFNLNNAYYSNVVSVLLAVVPRNANLVLAGHSLGGMVAQQVASDSSVKAQFNILNTVTFGAPLLSLGSREGTVKRLGDKKDFVPALSVQSVFIPLWAYVGLNKEDGGYSNPITAHKESYKRADVWGRYDVTGTKNGGAKLTLDLSTRVFYKSPIF